jgi:DNA-binding response OmpR family regulator
MTDFTSAKNRILLIDDDAGLRGLVTLMLQRIGYQPWTAETGIEGLEILRGEDFGLLILDLMLPDMDGLEVLRQIRQGSRWAEMPILILSARVDPETISQGLELGADGYLTKPYLTHSLTERVGALIANGRKKPD